MCRIVSYANNADMACAVWQKPPMYLPHVDAPSNWTRLALLSFPLRFCIVHAPIAIPCTIAIKMIIDGIVLKACAYPNNSSMNAEAMVAGGRAITWFSKNANSQVHRDSLYKLMFASKCLLLVRTKCWGDALKLSR
jgi:hypothetical protein